MISRATISHHRAPVLRCPQVGDGLLMHAQPGESYSYGVASVLAPAGEARLTVNGVYRPAGARALPFGWQPPLCHYQLFQ